MTKTLQDQKALEDLIDFTKGGRQGIAFALAMQGTDGTIEVFRRTSQPCYGELRVYADTDYRPGDLYDPFPDGTPVGVALKLTQKVPTTNAFFNFMSSVDGPFRELFETEPTLVIEGEHYVGVIFTDTRVSSDLMVNYMQIIRDTANHNILDCYNKALALGISPKVYSFLYYSHTLSGLSVRVAKPEPQDYYTPSRLDAHAWFTGTHKPLAPDWLFYNRAPYHRNSTGNLAHIWKGGAGLSDISYFKDKMGTSIGLDKLLADGGIKAIEEHALGTN